MSYDFTDRQRLSEALQLVDNLKARLLKEQERNSRLVSDNDILRESLAVTDKRVVLLEETLRSAEDQLNRYIQSAAYWERIAEERKAF